MQSLKFEILAAVASSPRPVNKINLIGRPNQRGDLERRLDVDFLPRQRALAARAFEDLKQAGLIEATYADLTAPEDWVVITEAGRNALKRHALDVLDEALMQISPHLVDIRSGAWAAVESGQPDSLRQAAHSGRELIDQVLNHGTVDQQIRAQPNFQPDGTSRSGITRRMRLKWLMQKHRGAVSDSELKVIEDCGDAVLSIDAHLTSMSHDRDIPNEKDVLDALHMAESMLWRLLVPRDS